MGRFDLHTRATGRFGDVVCYDFSFINIVCYDLIIKFTLALLHSYFYLPPATHDGETMKRAPILQKPADRTALGILGSLRTDEWGIHSLCEDGSSWKAALLVADNENTNKLVFRYLVSETDVFSRLLIAPVVCWAHNISNATRRSCGK